MHDNRFSRDGDLADQSATDDKYVVTIFSNVTAKMPNSVEEMTQSELLKLIRATKAATKADLPLLKLAKFGSNRSPARSLRHDANVEAISGIEVDYDAGILSFADVVDKLRLARLAFIAYTTPSHTDEQPRWRVIAFCSGMLPPGERSALVARLNGVLGGIVSAESFALSQIYYFGSISGAKGVQVESGSGDPIDLRDDLDAAAIAKSCNPSRAAPSALEAYLRSRVDWVQACSCHDLSALEKSQPMLFGRLQGDLEHSDKLSHRWTGGTDGLKDRSRSGRDRSIVQILQTMRYGITEAIAVAAAWGGSNPRLGRGWESLDKSHREIDIERYWVRCWIREDDAVPIPVEQLPPSPPRETERTRNPFPDECRNPHGAVGDLVRYFSRGMTRQVPDEFLIPMALAAIAYAAQNRFEAGTNKLKTSVQMYLVIMAKTGVGKTELSKMLAKLLEGSPAEHGIVESVASGPALLNKLHTLSTTAPYGPTMLYLVDEFGLMLQSRTGRSGPTHMKDLMDESTKLYGRGNSKYAGKAYADTKKDIKPIERANLSKVGFATEASLVEALTGMDAATGVINRYNLAALPDCDLPMKHMRDVDQTTPPKLVEFMHKIGDPDFPLATSQPLPENLKVLKDGLREYSKTQPALLPFDPKAEDRLDEITDELNKLAHGSDEITDSIWGRARQQVIVVAAILAIGEIDTEKDELQLRPITVDHIDWAWSFVRWSTQNWVVMFKTKVSESEEEAAMNRIRSLLEKVADYAPGGRYAHKADFGNSRNNSATCAQGWMPVSLIGRELRLPSDIKKRALAALLENEEIEQQSVEKPEGQPGRSAVTYRLAPGG